MYGLLGFGVLWLTGLVLGWPRRLTALLSLALWLGLVALAALRPPGIAGQAFRLWLLFGLGMALILGYRFWLARLRAKAVTVSPAAAPPAADTFSPTEVERYSRHILLREIGGTGQQRLRQARVLVVGAGGLGSPALLYLAGAGVGVIGVIDDDLVEGSNLQRQVIHSDARIGMPKVFSAEAALKALNPFIEIRPYHRRLDAPVAAALIADYDLVLDGTDNFDTRALVNRTCVALGKPLISGAITQWEGQLSLFDPVKGGPCYHCLFPERPAPGLAPTCAEAGVVAPLTGVIGSMMALEAVKAITGAGEGLRGRLLIHDALYAETRIIGIRPDPDCPVCAARQP